MVPAIREADLRAFEDYFAGMYDDPEHVWIVTFECEDGGENVAVARKFAGAVGAAMPFVEERLWETGRTWRHVERDLSGHRRWWVSSSEWDDYGVLLAHEQLL